MIEYSKKYVDLINGEKLAFIEKGNSDNTIILLHGNMASSVHMVTLMDELKDEYRVIAPDLRGFGDSSFNNEFLTLKELAFDLLLFLNKLNIKAAHILGWSTGFGVAMELAIIAPNIVKSLFSLEGMSVKGYYSPRNLENVFNSYSEMRKDKSMNFIPSALESNNYNLIKDVWEKTLLINLKLDDKLLDLYVKETLKQRCQMNINWCWVTFNISNEANPYSKGSGEMNKITCPIYITLGLKDNVVTPKMIDENIKLLKNTKVFTFENGSHCLHYDELNSVVKIIRKYLRKML